MAFPDSDFEMAIADLEQQLVALKDRYQQVCDDQSRLEALEAQKAELASQSDEVQKQESLKTEIQLIDQEIETLEVQLESSLMKWQEPFWQIIRFTGAGILIGWVLHSFV